MSEEYQLTLNDYISIAKRRWLHFMVPFLLAVMVSALVAKMLPPIYSSSGVILVESQQIPKNIVQSMVTGYVNERIQILKQRVMTRGNLTNIIRKFDLYKNSDANLSVSEKVSEIRENIELSLVSSGNKRSRSSSVIAFKLSFLHSSPAIASSVTNELITLFLKENLKSRTKRAEETTEFIFAEVEKLKTKLEDTEKKIAQFKLDNSDSLPENLGLNTQILERTENEIKSIDRSVEEIKQELRFLDIELSSEKQSAYGSVIDPERELNNLQIKYSELTASYTDHHPDVKAIKRKIEIIKNDLKNTGNSKVYHETVEPQGFNIERINLKINAQNKKIDSLTKQKQELEKKRQRYEQIILQTPHVKNALLSLTRDYENTIKKYKDMQAKEMEASLAETLEEEEKAEKFTLIEPPVTPETPIKPDRLKVFGMGIFVSFALAIGVVFLLEVSNLRIWGEDAITGILKQRPIISIPYIETVEEIERKKSITRKIILITFLIILILLSILHFYYMPIDMIVYKLIAR